MAAFNTGVSPTQDPNYLNYSKSVDSKADESGGILAKTIGDVFTSGIDAADSLVKRHIEDRVEDDVNTLRDQRLSELKYAQQQLPRPSLLSNTDRLAGSEVPTNLQALPAALSQLDARRANGKMSDTEYYAALDSKSKQLRNQFPGHVGYIDKEFEKVSGVNPANAEMKSRVADINAAITSANSDRNKAVSMLDKAINEGVRTRSGEYASDIKKAFLAGTIDSTAAEGWVNRAQNLEYEFKIRKSELENDKGERDLRSRNATDLVNDRSATAVNMFFNTIKTASGDTWAELQKKFRSGWRPSDEEAVKMGLGLRSQLVEIENSVMQEFTQTDTKGRSIAGYMGGAGAVRELVKQQMVNMKNIGDLVSNKQFDAATFAMESANARIHDVRKKMFDDPNIGPSMTHMETISKMGDPTIMTRYVSMLLGEKAGDIDHYLKENGLKIMAQPKKEGEGWFTFNWFSDRAKAVGTATPTVNNNILDMYSKIMMKSTSDEIKKNTLQAMFSSDNADYLSRYKNDSYDIQGNSVLGRNAVFTKILTPDIIKEATRLGMGKVVQQWAEQSFAKDLFMGDLNELRNGDPRLQIGWNEKDNRIEHKYTKASQLNNTLRQPKPEIPSYFADPIKTVERINGGLQVMANLAKTNGQDVSEYLVGLLADAGVKPNTLPAQLLQDMINQRNEKGKEMLKKGMSGTKKEGQM